MSYPNPVDLILSFVGGVLGAALGGVAAFIICGSTFLVGIIISFVSGEPSSLLVIPWGPVLGPHVAFAGGVAAAGYAAKRGILASGRDIVTMLMKFHSPAILAVGGIFGISGHVIKSFLDLIPASSGIPWFNSITLSIAFSSLIVRYTYGSTPLISNKNRIYKQWHACPRQVSILINIAAVISVGAAFTIKSYPHLLGLMFGIAAMALLLPFLGIKIPVILHVAWAAEYVTFISGNIGWGISAGVLAALLAETFAFFLLVDGDTHIDPPAMALAVVLCIFPIGMNTGLLKALDVFSSLFAFVFIVAGFFILRSIEKTTS